jgi:hypothetical protein
LAFFLLSFWQSSFWWLAICPLLYWRFCSFCLLSISWSTCGRLLLCRFSFGYWTFCYLAFCLWSLRILH